MAADSHYDGHLVPFRHVRHILHGNFDKPLFVVPCDAMVQTACAGRDLLRVGILLANLFFVGAREVDVVSGQKEVGHSFVRRCDLVARIQV